MQAVLQMDRWPGVRAEVPEDWSGLVIVIGGMKIGET
jgi:hypothetical protein